MLRLCTAPGFQEVVVLGISTAQLLQLPLVPLSRRHVPLQESLLCATALVKEPLHLPSVALDHFSPLLPANACTELH